MRLGRFILEHRLRLLLALVVIGLGCAGCGTEPQNQSEKPWNTPEGWQNGSMPTQMLSPH